MCSQLQFTAKAFTPHRAFYLVLLLPGRGLSMHGAKVLAVIPARFGSTRLPGKPLLPILGGEPMIAHVVRAALAATTVHKVLVATDHEGVAAAAARAGAHTVLTDGALPTGTDRVAAAMRLTGSHADVVVNVQGDEPLVEPSAIDLVARLLLTHTAADIATLSAPLPNEALLDPNRVKVVRGAPLVAPHASSLGSSGDDVVVHDACHRALYFSRAPIGMDRNELRRLLLRDPPTPSESPALPMPVTSSGSWNRDVAPHHAARLHVGLYAFRPDALQRFVALPPSPLEQLEQLEQVCPFQTRHEAASGSSQLQPAVLSSSAATLAPASAHRCSLS